MLVIVKGLLVTPEQFNLVFHKGINQTNVLHLTFQSFCHSSEARVPPEIVDI